MSTFGMQYLLIADYKNNEGVVTYENKTAVPGAMSAALRLRTVEGKLYADDRLYSYDKQVTGADLTLGTAGLTQEVCQRLYGAKATSREIPGISTSPVAGTAYSTNDSGKYVGLAFVSMDRVGDKTVYVAVFFPKCLFAPPDEEWKTKGENLEIRGETTTGKAMASDDAANNWKEVAVLDTLEDAKAWCDAVLAPAAA